MFTRLLHILDNILNYHLRVCRLVVELAEETYLG